MKLPTKVAFALGGERKYAVIDANQEQIAIAINAETAAQISNALNGEEKLLGLLRSVYYMVPLDVLRTQAGNGFLDMEACDNLWKDIGDALAEVTK